MRSNYINDIFIFYARQVITLVFSSVNFIVTIVWYVPSAKIANIFVITHTIFLSRRILGFMSDLMTI